LWGIGAAAFLIVTTQWRTRAFWICCVLLFAAALCALPLLQGWANSFWLAERVLTLGSDPGASVRYGVLVASLMESSWDPATWFGAGITNDYLAFGASGIGYLVRAAGVVGALLFVLSIPAAAPRGERVFLVTVTAMALTATTLWTYMFWWFWLGLILRRFAGPASQGAIEPEPVASNRPDTTSTPALLT
jgi:hypothetical protein